MNAVIALVSLLFMVDNLQIIEDCRSIWNPSPIIFAMMRIFGAMVVFCGALFF